MERNYRLQIWNDPKFAGPFKVPKLIPRTPKEVERMCARCGERYLTSRRMLFCGKKCKREADAIDRKEAKWEALRTGKLNGRPIREVSYERYQKGAKNRGIAFELSFERFCELWQQPCSYCGTKIHTIGIDRVDNSRGYTNGNICSCCPTCNKMKLTMTANEFVKKCAKIAEKAGFKWVLRR